MYSDSSHDKLQWKNIFLFLLLLIGLYACTGDVKKAGQGPDKITTHGATPTAAHKAGWSYHGETGPQYWGALDESYDLCAHGEQQSPIDLSDERIAPLPAIEIDFQPFVPTVINNGHTIEVDSAQHGKMVLDGKTYTLLQFHFHHLSEHTMNGQHFPLEAHFVHRAEDGTLGVLGVFFKAGKANSDLQHIWDLAPKTPGKKHGKTAFDAASLLPANRVYYRYEGSLTTPPCSQIVSWAIFSKPVEVSQAQIDAFARLYANNYRPTQNRYRRMVLKSR